MNQNLWSEALTRMGYREMSDKFPGVFGKPFGNSLLLPKLESTATFECWFVGADENKHLWSREKYVNEYHSGAPVTWIKYMESHFVKSIEYPSNFSFLTKQETIALCLGL